VYFVEPTHAIVHEPEAGYRFEHGEWKNVDLGVGSSVVEGYMECRGNFDGGVRVGCSRVNGL